MNCIILSGVCVANGDIILNTMFFVSSSFLISYMFKNLISYLTYYFTQSLVYKFGDLILDPKCFVKKKDFAVIVSSH